VQLTQSPIHQPEVTHASGRLQRSVRYAPRFYHHFRRRIRSDMSFGQAWHSTRLRMRDYR
jgi:hypothetical protein